MARIAGVNIPTNKRAVIALRNIHGIGPVNAVEIMDKVKIPVLHISGWWDGDGIGTKLNWAKMRSLGNKNQWLIYGPWTHAFNSTSRIGDVDYDGLFTSNDASIFNSFFKETLPAV